MQCLEIPGAIADYPCPPAPKFCGPEKAPICLVLSGNMPCELTTDGPHKHSVAGLPRRNLPAVSLNTLTRLLALDVRQLN